MIGRSISHCKTVENLGHELLHAGKIYEQQGNQAKAIDHYEKFLTLWQDADPGIPEVEDAKEQLAGLKSQ